MTMTKMMRKKRKALDGPVAKRQHAEYLAVRAKRRRLARETERKHALAMNLDITHKRLARAHEERKHNERTAKKERKDKFREIRRRKQAENRTRKLAAELLRRTAHEDKRVVWEGPTSTGTTEVFQPAFDLHTSRDEPTGSTSPIADESSSFPGIPSPMAGSWADGSSWETSSTMDSSLAPNAVSSPRYDPTLTAEAGTSFTLPGDRPTLVAESVTNPSFAGRDEPTLVAKVTSNVTFAGSDDEDLLDDTNPSWDHIFETAESVQRQGRKVAAGIADIQKFLLEPFPNHLRRVETPRPAGMPPILPPRASLSPAPVNTAQSASESFDNVPTVQVQVDDEDEEMYIAQSCDEAQPKEASAFMNPESDESLLRRARMYQANVIDLKKSGGPEIHHTWAAKKFLLAPTSPAPA